MKSGINSEWVLAECIKKLGFTSGEIERVFEALDKGLLVSKVWVLILEILGAFGVCFEEFLGSPKFQEVTEAERKKAKSRYVLMLF